MMKDPSYDLREAYFNLLSGNITYKNEVVKVYDEFVSDKTAPDFYILLREQTNSEIGDKSSYTTESTILVEVYSEHAASTGGKKAVDLIGDDVLNLIKTGSEIAISEDFKSIYTTLDQSNVSSFKDNAGNIQVIKQLRFRHEIGQGENSYVQLKSIDSYTWAEIEAELTAEQLAAAQGSICEQYSDAALDFFEEFPDLTDHQKYHLNEFINNCDWENIKEVYIPVVGGFTGLKGLLTAEAVNGATASDKGFEFDGTNYVTSKYNQTEQGDDPENTTIGVIAGDVEHNSQVSFTGFYQTGGGIEIGIIDGALYAMPNNAYVDTPEDSYSKRMGIYGRIDDTNSYLYTNSTIVNTIASSGSISNGEILIGATNYRGTIEGFVEGNIEAWAIGSYDPALFDPAVKKLLSALSPVTRSEPLDLYNDSVSDQKDFFVTNRSWAELEPLLTDEQIEALIQAKTWAEIEAILTVEQQNAILNGKTWAEIEALMSADQLLAAEGDMCGVVTVSTLPDEFFIATGIGTSELTYYTDSYRTFDLQPYTETTIHNTNEIIKKDSDLYIAGNYAFDNSYPVIVIALKGCYIRNNELKITSFEIVELVDVDQNNIINQVHGLIYYRDFLYAVNRQSGEYTILMKINPDDLSDFTSFQLDEALDGQEMRGGSNGIIGYGDYIYFTFTNSISNPALYKVDLELTAYELVKQMPDSSRGNPAFVIYENEFYYVAIDSDTTGKIVAYNIAEDSIRESATFPTDNSGVSVTGGHWITVYNNKLLVSTNNDKKLLRLDISTLVIEENISVDVSITDDNSIINGYLYLNGEENPFDPDVDVVQLLKVKYDDFTDTNIEIDEYVNGRGSYGSINHQIEIPEIHQFTWDQIYAQLTAEQLADMEGGSSEDIQEVTDAIARYNTYGDTPLNETQETALSTLINALVDAGQYEHIIEIFPRAGMGSAANCLVGLKNYVSENFGATWTNTGGLMGDGSSAYIDTNLNLVAAGFNKNDITLGVRTGEVTTYSSLRYLISAFETSTVKCHLVDNATLYAYTGGDFTNLSEASTSHNFYSSKTDANSLKIYKGVTEGNSNDSLDPSSDLPNKNLFELGNHSAAGTANGFYNGAIQLSYYGDSSLDLSVVIPIFDQFLTDLGVTMS